MVKDDTLDLLRLKWRRERKDQRVRCIETGKVFAGVRAASLELGIKRTSIRGSCHEGYSVFGLHFTYLRDGDTLKLRPAKAKPVTLPDGTRYASVADLAEKLFGSRKHNAWMRTHRMLFGRSGYSW